MTSLSVSAQSKMPIPGTDFANYSGLVSLTAELGEDDNLAACTKQLQARADNLLDSYMQGKREAYRAEIDARTRKIHVPAAEKMAAATEQTGADLVEKYKVKK